MMRVLHVITGLNAGGAETMLLKLIGATGGHGLTHVVASLVGDGPLRSGFEESGVSVYGLDIRSKVMPLGGLRRLAALVRRLDPDLIQGWMYHGNLASVVPGVGQGRPVAWNVRQSLHDATDRLTTRWTIRLCAGLSRRPARIIYNSRTAMLQHGARGFNLSRSVVLPNGFDCGRIRPDADLRSRLRREFLVGEDELVVGMVARWHPVKNHPLFIEAAAAIAAKGVRARYVLVGRGVDDGNRCLVDLIRRRGLAADFRLLGERQDADTIATAFDLSVLSSHAESFPNVVGEAMLCGTPCVATDVGDVADVVGDTGLCVPPGDVEALAAACRSLLGDADARRRRGEAARRRIVENYSLEAVGSRYADLYRTILEGAS